MSFMKNFKGSLIKKILYVLAFSIFVTGFAFSQSEDDWYSGKVISQINFEGLKSIKRADLHGITDDFIGKHFSDKIYNDILDRLYSLGYFEDIEPYAKPDSRNDGKVILVFNVHEHPVVSEINFKGNKQIRNNELRESLTIKTGDVYLEQTVLIDERGLRDLYIKKGYTNAKVSHEVEDTPDGEAITFHISEGAETIVKEITFTGNVVFNARTLKSKISLKENGFMKKGAYQRSSVEADKATILNYYATKGYIDARILDVVQNTVTNEKKGREEISINFIIQEGEPYTFSGLTITGNEIFSTEKLMGLVRLEKNKAFNQSKFQESLQNITNLYYENGYMANEFIPRADKDTERHTIGYALLIVEKTRAHVENIIIKGNDKTKDEVILREIPLKPGDVFSRNKIMNGMRNLYNTQYFSSIVPEPVQGSEENLVDLVVTVEEQSTTSLQLGMTFTGIDDPDDLPISLFFKWQNSNFMGTGKTISAGVNTASSSQSVDFSYGQNWLFGIPVSLNESLSLFHSDSSALSANWLPDGTLDDDYYYFGYESWGASLSSSMGRRFNPDFAILTVSGGMSNSITDNLYDEGTYVPLDAGVNKYANRFGLKNSVFAQISLDDRDINYDPSTGWFASQKLAWYGIIPEVEHEFYLRSETKLESYLKLFDIPVANGYWNFKGVLACYTGISLVYPVPGTIFGDSSKVYIDGMFNGRGWTDVYNKTRGKAMISNRIELRLPIYTGMIGLDGFFDAVAVKDEPEDLLNDLSIEDFYFSFGPGLKFLVPQFPLHLLFANKFRVKDGEVEWDDTWQFVMSFNITNR